MLQPGHVGVHVGDVHADFLAVLAVSAVATAALCWIGAAAYRQRRSHSYLLVALALGALLARPVVTGLTATGVLTPETHHLLEHGLDVVLVALVVAAVYYARTVERRVEEEI